jgi:hypothetical protein
MKDLIKKEYSNSVYSEYVCCHILNELGFEAQETLIGVIVQKTTSGEITEEDVRAIQKIETQGRLLFRRLNNKSGGSILYGRNKPRR